MGKQTTWRALPPRSTKHPDVFQHQTFQSNCKLYFFNFATTVISQKKNNFQTVDEHMQLSFSHIMKHWKRNPNQPGTAKTPGSRNVLLRFYPPQSAIGKQFSSSKTLSLDFLGTKSIYKFEITLNSGSVLLKWIALVIG